MMELLKFLLDDGDEPMTRLEWPGVIILNVFTLFCAVLWFFHR